MSSGPVESSGVRRAWCHSTRVFEGHTDLVTCVAYFPDGRRIASASIDKTVIIWDVESGRQDGQPLQHDFSVESIAISPNGRRIASGMEGDGLIVWDALTLEVVHEIKGGVYGLAYSPDGHWIATTPIDDEREVQLLDADTGRPGREPLKCDASVSCVAFSPDGSRIAVGLWNGYFQVIDIATGESVVGPIKGHTHYVMSVVYSPDGHLLITGSGDSSIQAWDSKTGVEAGKPMLGHEDDVQCISVSADGRIIASAGFDGTVRVWDLETRLQVGDSFHTDEWALSVAFSPDNQCIITGGTDGDVYLIDMKLFAIQRSSSPPTTSAQNAPLPTVYQGIDEAISRFCNTLTKPQISVSLVDAPNDWLRANSAQILQVPSIHGKARVEVNLIYPRLFVYTSEFLECYVPRWRV
ncbi:WD40 repeat-like protein [Leucogyrophana mollusca]|uniref:WD40 repeat-like protein n=1 Tax=Leucogyrophana mollusca TaxID=85980 RepID=A0ACB8B0I1_9AGAM|nr:WD40 repeat-like protein [Leucogyrophana mollusca]